MLPGVVLVVGVAIIFALLIAWQIQRPVRDMAEAAEQLSRQHAVKPLRERGPHELRQLIVRFNRMVADLARIDQERNTMLAGIAHDLKTPLARLRLRAEMLSDPKAAAGVTRDVDSMAAIVEQFLSFAQSSEPTARPVPVDKRIGELALSLQEQDRTVVLELAAGEELPDDRHPARPHHRQSRRQRLCLRRAARLRGHGAGAGRLAADGGRSGPGIPEEAMERVTLPFVRLDPARGGNAHSGLGLAIVDRLVRQAGGRLTLLNRPDGGLRVEMVFPFAALAQAA